ncbi:unnamed protein product [Brachionus calyciflorus]|uniref:SAGA-associated factor 11 homolog n=1 Tax=Brachionus calyciflorus TaxID=104777 RepID=A0A813XDT8_9BILA|nr:unnamed protein product [Brachionus calyciflorus]
MMHDVDMILLEEKIYYNILDDVIFGLMLQIHRAAKLDYLKYLDVDMESDKQYEIYDDNDVMGIFSGDAKMTSGGGGSSGRNGQNSVLLKYECICPNCDRSLAAIRFAPHLEKCMGMGRNSSRIATRRIANYNGGDELDQLIEAHGLLPNPSYNKTSTNQTRDDDLMSIINAVATANSEAINASSSSSSLIDIELSSSSSSSVSNNYSSIKTHSAKKKRIQPKINKANSTPPTTNQINRTNF